MAQAGASAVDDLERLAKEGDAAGVIVLCESLELDLMHEMLTVQAPPAAPPALCPPRHRVKSCSHSSTTARLASRALTYRVAGIGHRLQGAAPRAPTPLATRRRALPVEAPPAAGAPLRWEAWGWEVTGGASPRAAHPTARHTGCLALHASSGNATQSSPRPGIQQRRGACPDHRATSPPACRTRILGHASLACCTRR